MRRGDLLTVSLQGERGKPRPASVAQADRFGELPAVTVLPIDRHAPRRRSRRRLADRLGVRRLGLAPLHGGLHASRRHQLHRRPKPGQRARLVVRRAARSHAHQARRQPGKEPEHRPSSRRPADSDRAGGINRVHLENMSGQIQADNRNLAGGWFPFARFASQQTTLAPRCREQEPSTPSAMGTVPPVPQAVRPA